MAKDVASNGNKSWRVSNGMTGNRNMRWRMAREADAQEQPTPHLSTLR